jgi:hypothetical protein
LLKRTHRLLTRRSFHGTEEGKGRVGKIRSESDSMRKPFSLKQRTAAARLAWLRDAPLSERGYDKKSRVFKTFVNKYENTKCKVCSEPIAVGERFSYSFYYGSRHHIVEKPNCYLDKHK